MKINEVRNNVFYQFPKWLLEEEYKHLSIRAKIVYMLVFDRRTYSIKNNWYDKNGDVYVYFTIEELVETLSCSRQTIINAKKELNDCGLIQEVYQGLNRPNRIYIFGSLENRPLGVQNLDAGSLENRPLGVQNLDAGSLENRPLGVQNLDSIKTKYIKTKYNNTKVINTDDDAGQKSFSKIIKDSNIKINERHTQMLMDYIALDHFTIPMIQYAVERTEDAGSTSFNYLNKILKSWKDKGYTTLEEVKESDRIFEEKKKDQNNRPKDFKSGKYALLGTDISVHEIDPELGF